MLRVPREENQMLICPYDKSHSIRLARMQVHLVKCRQNHLSAKMAQCPFNSIHIVHKMELDVHIKICPQRKGFEAFRMKDELINETFSNNTVSNENFELRKTNVPETCENDWDYAPVYKTYNPGEYAKNANILRQPVGLTPSQRREFRAQERQRLLGEKTE